MIRVPPACAFTEARQLQLLSDLVSLGVKPPSLDPAALSYLRRLAWEMAEEKRLAAETPPKGRRQ